MFAFAVLASSRVPRYPVRPVAPVFRIPRPFPRPVPVAKLNGEEEEDPENIWGTIAKEVIKEAAKSAAADAIYSGAK
ncbi:hypothetical protein TVAG_247940 [Trichomonas vaginalis G3]|uniref:Uncharacterized protein n=1 Tax=Trichomonas vaginalis (strain ATCC PRA-98 / G3) TaxID=412133 RepID=A2FRE9_TRIV3|nr:hypothetical protein TVAGG3_0042350 [Trichomonas vaginalis G3]EAX92513.1 hypothetical protein TVAG_247940 [Trichomonas vaginalis G3]KAI5540781.1 hypothetical protein TVAGG3_0042350 [Trichomonas vaginalis G3]|eukprot:XP_001305443.1 hypothetical protein [Trichomonas vaginalis G3]